eukprot:7669592-Ditylum_brightwellii.AAC.1
MEENTISMELSTPALSAITISYSPTTNSMNHSIILEMVTDESTIKAAEAVVALGFNLKQQNQPNL